MSIIYTQQPLESSEIGETTLITTCWFASLLSCPIVEYDKLYTVFHKLHEYPFKKTKQWKDRREVRNEPIVDAALYYTILP